VEKYMKKNRGEGRMTGEVGQRVRLQKPLGNWNMLANESERMWPFYYSHNTDTLYRSYIEKWHRNRDFYYDCHTMTDNNIYDYITSGNVKLLLEDASPTVVMDTKQGWRIPGHLPVVWREPQRVTTTTLMEYIMAHEEHISQYYTQINFLTIPIKIYELQKLSNKVIIATDGGAIPLKGSLGFVLADEEGSILLTCHGQP
jgi:hypothetical protein